MIEGPVGTGKTETCKELAKCLGRMCFTFSCNNTLTTDSLLKFFKGFVSGGSWACFDEFNLIESSVLGALAQTIMTLN
jgi:dynein heavy chain